MKMYLDAEFESKIPWYAKAVMALSMMLMDLGMKLSGLEQEDK